MTGLLEVLDRHVSIVPILLPLVASAAMLLLHERRRRAKAIVSSLTLAAMLAATLRLLAVVADASTPEIVVYRLANWSAPYGIVLVADRLSVLMVLVTVLLGAAGMTYALARWATLGPRFHSLYLLLLMGLCGAFLTGDLFNLYVFFEVLLAASYGLALHGSGKRRVKAGLHYVAINLAASVVFLVGVSLVYAVTGTLNMADLADKVGQLGPDNLVLLKAGLSILGVAFLVKSGAWPLSFWLPTTYSAAAAPVAAIFAVMTKVGVYVILRLVALLWPGGEALALFGSSWLLYLGLATVLFGTFGVLASAELPRMAGYLTMISSGTVLAVVASGDPVVLSSALYYLIGSTIGIGVIFLLCELVNRRDGEVAQAVGPVFHDDFETQLRNEFEGVELGVTLPLATTLLAAAFFFVALQLVGLPPLSGFIAKFGMLAAVVEAGSGGYAHAPASAAWWVVGVIVFSGFCVLVALMRKGVSVFWAEPAGTTRVVRPLEAVPVAFLIALLVALTVLAQPALRYTAAASAGLEARSSYLSSVLQAPAGEEP
ncbi:MAG: monovalent cation/H+ antiporter subunit D [Trueperaceae bacterium]|nr:monovalent cation/H+ antiporter subunit D [Trueperaceae bacterium]MCO5174605.1 monovalent cation/H+ antiporter subunit D [Trueperaceae bacterium]MCW5819639.1 monovalent cation/H+ antiporter subunit D [Trueperaceae bacterium]